MCVCLFNTHTHTRIHNLSIFSSVYILRSNSTPLFAPLSLFLFLYPSIYLFVGVFVSLSLSVYVTFNVSICICPSVRVCLPLLLSPPPPPPPLFFCFSITLIIVTCAYSSMQENALQCTDMPMLIKTPSSDSSSALKLLQKRRWR